MSMAEAFAEASSEASEGGSTDTFSDVSDGGEEAVSEAPVVETDTAPEPSDTPDVPEFDGPPQLDPDEFGDYMVTVKVNGEEVQVPVREALSGYQRQADYTRKTQELAAERQAVEFANTLQAALEHDPYATLQALAQRYGVVPQAQQPEFDDPLEARIWELEQQLNGRLGTLEQYQGQAMVEAEIARMRSKFDDFDEHSNEVIGLAAKTGLDLESAYKIATFDKVRSSASDAEKRAQQAAAAREAKRKSSVVSSGGSSAGKPQMSDEPADDSIASAYAWAQGQKR